MAVLVGGIGASRGSTGGSVASNGSDGGTLLASQNGSLLKVRHFWTLVRVRGVGEVQNG